MNRSVYKYPLLMTDLQVVELPLYSEILTIQIQADRMCLWALVDPTDTQTEERKIRLTGTGHDIPKDTLKYISTIQFEEGRLVFHAFEVV